MPCLDGDEEYQKIRQRDSATSERLKRANQGRVFAAEHTGLLEENPERIWKTLQIQGAQTLVWEPAFCYSYFRNGSGYWWSFLNHALLRPSQPGELSSTYWTCRQAGWECLLNPCRWKQRPWPVFFLKSWGDDSGSGSASRIFLQAAESFDVNFLLFASITGLH